jgi:hypothetical protein
MPERSTSSKISKKSGGDKENRKGTGDTHAHMANIILSSTNEQRTSSKLPAIPISSQLDPTAPFLRDFIPSEQEHPELRRSSTQKWYGICSHSVMSDDDSERYSTLKIMVDFLNDAMHKEWASVHQVTKGVATHSDDPIELTFHNVDDLPLVESLQQQPPDPEESDDEDGESEEERYLESDERMEKGRDSHWNTLHPRKTSFKETSPGVFTLELSFQGVTSPRIVNDNMPLRTLFIMATSYLRSEFKFVVNDSEDIDLMYKNRLLSRDGVLGGAPILDAAIILIISLVKP